MYNDYNLNEIQMEVICTHGAVVPQGATSIASGFDIRARGFSEVVDGKVEDPCWFGESVKNTDYLVESGAILDPARARGELYSEYVLMPGQSVLIKTGLQIKLPKPRPIYNTIKHEFEDGSTHDVETLMGYIALEAQVRPRSGLALKNKITVLNTPGTIDNDYRNDYGVILINHSDKPFIINANDRIAQCVFNQVFVPISEKIFKQVDEFTPELENERDMKGFGDSGVK